MQSKIGISDGINLIRESDGPSRQILGLKSGDKAHRILKSKSGIGL